MAEADELWSIMANGGYTADEANRCAAKNTAAKFGWRFSIWHL